MSETHVSASSHSASFTHKQRSIALTVVAMAFVMDLLDGTIVNVAIPTIQQNLGASYAAIQWLIAGYSLTFALGLITGGRMGDVFGYKKIFMIGVAGFTFASLLCGLSVNPGMLISSRLFQGAMAALMVPQVLSLMQVMFKPEERGAVNGLFGALGGMAASLGPVIGGLLIRLNVANLDWRPIFLINVPVGVFALIAAKKYLPNGKSDHPLKLDLTGTGLVLVAMTLLIFPLIQGRELDWPAWSIIMMVASIPVFVLFGKWLKHKMAKDSSALIVPELFRSQSFTAGLLVNLLFQSAIVGFFLTFTLVIQIGLGFSALHAALTGLPVAFGIAFTMALAGKKLIPILGRRAIWVGTVAMSCGLLITLLILNHYETAIHSWQLIPGQLLVGIGMGFVFATLFAAVLNGVPVKHAGSASGVLNAVQQVGAAVGVALIGVIFFGQISSASPQSFSRVEPELRAELSALQIPAEAQTGIVAAAKTCFVDRAKEKDSTIVPQSCKQTTNGNQSGNQADKQIGDIVKDAALRANDINFTNAFKHAVFFDFIVLAAVFMLSLLLPKKMSQSPHEGV